MKPNIVFITSDQQRRDSLGIYGCRYVSTPNLDRLGSQATVYEHCYCNAPVCTPSRACMMTGKTMPGHGVYNLFDILPENEKMLPYYLREQGYESCFCYNEGDHMDNMPQRCRKAVQWLMTNE